MRRLIILILGLLAGTRLAAGEAALAGRIEDRTYVASGGLYRVPIPVLPELGGTVSDTANVVTFADNFTTYLSIASFPLDAAQLREDAARGRKDYLTNFFTALVLPDFVGLYGRDDFDLGACLLLHRIKERCSDEELLGGQEQALRRQDGACAVPRQELVARLRVAPELGDLGMDVAVHRNARAVREIVEQRGRLVEEELRKHRIDFELI